MSSVASKISTIPSTREEGKTSPCGHLNRVSKKSYSINQNRKCKKRAIRKISLEINRRKSQVPSGRFATPGKKPLLPYFRTYHVLI